MPVLQFDFCYIKTAGEQATTAILTGTDVETGMVMATMVGDKQQDFQYHVQCIKSFVMECGRVPRSTQQHNTAIRSRRSPDCTPANSSKQDGRQHQNFTSTRQCRKIPSNTDGTNQNIQGPITTKLRQNNRKQTPKSYHGWLRHAAYLLNRYATHADGNTSYFCRWNRDPQAPLCEFGKTVQYLLPTAKQLPKMEQQFFRVCWLGRDTTSGETLLGIGNKVVRARTI